LGPADLTPSSTGGREEWPPPSITLGISPGERVAIVSPNSGRFLVSFFGVSGFGRVLVPINFRLNTQEGRLHRRPLGGERSSWSTRAGRRAGRGERQRARRPGRGAGPGALRRTCRRRPRPEPMGARRAPPPAASTTPPAPRPDPGRAAHAPHCWLNAVTFGWHTTVTDRDVLLHTLPMFTLQRLGHALRDDRDGRPSCRPAQGRGEEILARVESEGVTLMCGAPAVVAAVLGCCRSPSRAGPYGAGRRHGPNRGRGRAPAVEDHRAGWATSSLGGSSRSTA